MSKRSANSPLSKLMPESSKEPPTKILTLSRKSIENRGEASPRVAASGLCGMPSELLGKIIGMVVESGDDYICHHNRIRATSERLRDANDVFVMHEFRKMLYRQTNLNPTSCGSAELQIIEYATEVYVRSGFGSTFCGCILPMLRSSYRDPLCVHTSHMSKFLQHFYNMVDQLGDSSSQRSRLLYNLMLMRFFRVNSLRIQLKRIKRKIKFGT